MNKFEKQWANKDIRKESKKVIEKWDAEPKGKKRGGKKACPGWKSHEKMRKIELTFPCTTCKRKFCSLECYELHESICQAKFYESKTGDITPLIEAAKAIYDKYINHNGTVKMEHWSPEEKKDGRISFMFKWSHQDLTEAIKILKKNAPDSLHKEHKKFWW